jgi:hypothetical protein
MVEVNAKPGDVIDLRPGDRKWAHEPVRLRVTAIRYDLSHYYDDLIWIEGDELDADGLAIRWTQELVKVTALNR